MANNLTLLVLDFKLKPLQVELILAESFLPALLGNNMLEERLDVASLASANREFLFLFDFCCFYHEF